MPYQNYHPVCLQLEGKPVLIVGGGAVAVEKLNSLLPTGARITVVSPTGSDEIRNWRQAGRLEWRRRRFEESDIDGAFMVIAATADPELNAWVYELGNRALKLTNSVDDPEHCNFIMAAIAKSGPMTVAISSAGCSPALAQRIRNRIETEILTPNVGRLAAFLGARRPQVKAALADYKSRQRFWESVLDSRVPQILGSQGENAADDQFQAMLRRAAVAAIEPLPVDPHKVYLVGAGPGDPGLITLRAVEILRQADVVLYDRLVNPILLGYAPVSAECIYVGKERGTPGKGRQETIHELMIEHAQAGKLVVRLKGGDPFVFGRGGEEALALATAGVAFEVVPGISSAVAAAESAHIPVTHRGISAGFAVFAGQEAEGGDGIPWNAAAKIPTAVFLMGVERLPVIVERLLAEGRDPSTPVAIVSNASLPTQRVAVGSLETITALAEGIEPPATIIVGEVVTVRAEIQSALAASFANLAAPAR